MSNTTTNTAGLSTNLLRRLALMQHLCEDYFIIEGDAIEGIEPIVFEGSEEDAREGFLADIEGTEEPDIDANFRIYCENNLTQVEEFNPDNYDNDYLVLTDSEADDKAKEYITESLWAFTASFLSERTGLDAEVFEAIQSNGKCESNNDTIYNLVQKLDDIDSFVDAAISADGRGHFMSSYDGNENEEEVQGTTFYIYRIN